MADDIGEHGIEKNVKKWKSYICRVVRSPTVLTQMPSFLNQADVRQIKDIHQNSSTKATLLLIDKLIKCEQPGKWTAFTQALERSDYGYLVSFLTSNHKSPEDSRHQRTMLQTFAPYMDILEPIELIGDLSTTGLINAEDRQEIISSHEQQGSVAATMLMIDRLQRRQAPSVWYTDFLRVLHQKGYTELVKEMEPDFTVDCEVLKTPTIIFTDSSDSEEDKHLTSSTLEEAIEYRVDRFKNIILDLVTVEKLLPHLCDLISIDRLCHVTTRQNSTRQVAMDTVLEEIMRSKTQNKWRCFVECLRKADYHYVAELLNRPRSNLNISKERCLLDLFVPTLGVQVEPMALIPHMLKMQVINTRDIEEIILTYHHTGSMAASVVMLERMQCRLAPHQWYKAFLQSLIQCDRQDLVETIDPDFLKRSNNNNDVDETNDDNGDPELDEQLEEAYRHVYNMNKENNGVVSKLRDHWRRLEQALVDRVDKEYQDRIKILDDVAEQIQCLKTKSTEAAADNEPEKTNILERLSEVTSSRVKIIPDKQFLSAKQIAIVHDSNNKHSHVNKDSLLQCEADDRRQLFARKRHLSVGSSSSSQSSGFAVVNKNKTRSYSSETSFSSSSQSSGFVSVNKTKTRHVSLDKSSRVTFAVTHHFPTFNRSATIDVKSSTEIPNLSKSRLEEAKIKPILVTNRRRCLSESSVVSNDGSLSSLDIPSSIYTDRKTESSSITSTLTKVSNMKPVERTDSLLYHQGFRVPTGRKCLLSNVCVLPSKHVVLVNSQNASLIIFEETTKTFSKEFNFNRVTPLQVCALQDSNLLVLLQKRDGLTKMCQYQVMLSQKRVDNLVYKSDVTLGDACHGSVCAISSGKGRVICLCINKHVHVLSQDCCVEKMISLDTQELEWWPHLCACDPNTDAVYVHDVYSQRIYCFTNLHRAASDVKCSPVWTGYTSEIEGMVVCGSHLFVSENCQYKISRLNTSDGKPVGKPLSENVRRPFALSRIPGQETIIVTQYHAMGTKMNRAVKYF